MSDTGLGGLMLVYILHMHISAVEVKLSLLE